MALLVVGAITGIVVRQSRVNNPATVPAGGSHAQIGRYAFATPPQSPDGTSAYNNFVWVLDTEAGDIRAYRIVNFTDAKGASHGWAVEALEPPPPAPPRAP